MKILSLWGIGINETFLQGLLGWWGNISEDLAYAISMCAHCVSYKHSLQTWDSVWTDWGLKTTKIIKWAITGRLSVSNHTHYIPISCAGLTIIWVLSFFFNTAVSLKQHFMMKWWRHFMEPACLELYWQKELGQKFILSMS